MKKEVKKIIIIALLAGAILIPTIVHILFKIPSPCKFLEPVWYAGDLLNLYAVVFASLFAIYGISITLKSSQDELNESVRNQALPFIITDFLETRPKQIDLLSADTTEELPDPDNTEFEEYSLREFYYVIKEAQIEVVRHLSGEQLTKVKNGGFKKVSPAKGVYTIGKEYYVYFHLNMENVGKGAAVHTRVGLNRQNVDINERKYVKPIPLRVGDTLSVGIYADIENENSHVLGDYLLEIRYSDMYGNKYCQEHELIINHEAEQHMFSAMITTEQNQKRL